ncbi:MAG: divergent polysaccharide deacetylase family protein [Spirochaetales bacterium]|nr:divergent polysaccharide deacetylase family protein [Spirochaetales bacterium]
MINRRKKGNERITIYLLLGLIGILLIALLYVIAGNAHDSRVSDTGTPDDGSHVYHDHHDTQGTSQGEGAGGQEGAGSMSGHDTSSVHGTDKGRLFIVIDDVGNTLTQLQYFLNFPGAITFSIMPQRTYSREAVNEIRAAKKEYIMHQPMESIDEDMNPGVGAVFAGMDKDTIYDIMNDNLATVPGVRGMNNHMGSRVTSDPDTLAFVFDFIKEKNMFFLDSMTMPVEKRDISADLALKYALKYKQRNTMFLDNENDRSSILRMIEEGKKVAGKKGHAVMIGHVVTSELADILIENYPELIDEGYSFHGISELFEEDE